eukprot:tig00022075_g23620.t1
MQAFATVLPVTPRQPRTPACTAAVRAASFAGRAAAARVLRANKSANYYGARFTAKQPAVTFTVECKKRTEEKQNKALLLDCDGVIADTERDGHRISFNRAFEEFGINAEWGVEEYGELVKIGGGKERMTAYFDQVGWPEAAIAKHGGGDKKKLIAELHKLKTKLFMDLVGRGELPARPGIVRLVDEAIAADYRISFDGLFAGDMVSKKKPHPEIYIKASEFLNVPPEKCVVIEDSGIGLEAAKAANMNCIVTLSSYTGGENFNGADAIVPSLDEGNVTLTTLEDLINKRA